jgi:hypothetical protein
VRRLGGRDGGDHRDAAHCAGEEAAPLRVNLPAKLLRTAEADRTIMLPVARLPAVALVEATLNRRSFLIGASSLVALSSIRSASAEGPATGIPGGSLPPGATAWRVDELPAVNQMRETILAVLEAKRIEYPGQSGWVQAFWAGDAYHGVFARDLATIGPMARFLFSPGHLRSGVEEFLHLQTPSGPEMGALPGVFYPGGGHDKATATSDEDLSVIHLAYLAYRHEAGAVWLRKAVNGASVIQRLNWAMEYLLRTRADARSGLITRANTTDWGDVKAEGGLNPTDRAPGDPAVLSIYDQALLFRGLLELAEMNDGAGLPAVAAEWRGRALAVRTTVNDLFWQPQRGFYRARIPLDATPRGYDEDAILGIGNVEVVRAGLADAEQARLIFINFERARLEARSPKVGIVNWPPYPEGVFASMLPGEYQNGGIWDWWGGRQIEAEFEAGQAALAYQHLAALAADWAHRPGEVWEWQELWTLRPRGSARYSGAAAVVGSAIVAGLFGIEMTREGYRISPRLAGRSGAVVADQPGTGRTFQLELGGLADGQILLRYRTTYAVPGEMRYLLPPGHSFVAAALDGQPLTARLEVVGDDRYVAFPIPGGAHQVQIRVVEA